MNNCSFPIFRFACVLLVLYSKPGSLQFGLMHLNDLYRKYFEHQAINHPDLNHDPEGARIFEVVGMDEALGDFRSKTQEKGFAFRLMEYDYRLEDKTTGNAQKVLRCGFVLSKWHSNRSQGKESYFQAMEQSEKVVDEIVEKMVADSQNGHPLFNHSLNTVDDVFVQPKRHTGDAGYSGWIVLFTISNHWRNCITHEDAPAWKDNGQTPHWS